PGVDRVFEQHQRQPGVQIGVPIDPSPDPEPQLQEIKRAATRGDCGGEVCGVFHTLSYRKSRRWLRARVASSSISPSRGSTGTNTRRTPSPGGLEPGRTRSTSAVRVAMDARCATPGES